MSNTLSLDPLTFPLHGRRLIEASAGTGKTYTITALYLRLLLGHGPLISDCEGEQTPLNVDQILVVTFTEAATEELRDRIRSRIQDAWQVLRGAETSDPLLSALCTAQPDPEQAARRLELAARQMDEAAIYTIHGFCQRMLKQHAFESGSLFETELITDDSHLRRQALLDIWRGMIYPAKAELSEAIQQIWPAPDLLLKDLKPMLGSSDLRLIPELDYSDLEQQWQASRAWLESFKQQWQANSDDLAELIQKSGVNKNSYRKTSVPKWLEQIGAYARNELNQVPEESIEKLCQSRLAEKTAAGKPVPEHPLFDLCDQYFDNRLPLKELLLSRTRDQIEKRFSQLKRDLRQLSFDDLLSQFDSALQGPSGETLSRAVGRQFPIAMIDEFQDTDPLQYRIFSTLYPQSQQQGLFMIGDPKQAIYGFRGADIFTYIQARRQVADHYTLDTNWRSSEAMISSVNALFSGCDSPFIYDQDIPFEPVKAGGQADKKPFTLYGKQPPALQFWRDHDELISKADYLEQMAEACAADISQKLDIAAEGEARVGDRLLRANDIAVLVRNRQEAAAVRNSLADRGIASVYLSGRDSVFSSREASDLNLILQAVAEPLDERRLRAALATSLLNFPAHELDQLSHNEKLWESLVTEFSDYHDYWQRLGVLPMLRRLMRQRRLAEALQVQPYGERRLTDLLHLGELLQKASLEQESIASLLRWFNEQLLSPNGDSDDQRVRLESDSQLVTVITIHKSKGLEYPLVYLPFACNFTKAKQTLFHDEEDRLSFDLDVKNKESLAQADRERLAEDLRLLYVAVTRAVYACYVGIANPKQGNSKTSYLHLSGLGHLLMNGASSLERLHHSLENLSASGQVTVTVPPQTDQQRGLFDLPVEQPQDFQARQFRRRLQRDWRISSYSGLVTHHSSPPPLPGLDLEVVDEQDGEPQLLIEPQQNIFSFPKGAQAGTFLHELFEEIEFTDHLPGLEPLLQQKCQLAGYEEHWIPVLEQLCEDVLQTPLPDQLGGQLQLAQLPLSDRKVEMEFMLPCAGLNATALNQLIRQYDPLSVQAGELEFDQLKGMLKGFIDLTFRYQGRYYILDYKSNWLGASVDDYHGSALEQAMIEHRYDLQYQLYSLALHRLLSSRMPEYDYQQHFGGVFYLFLRGMRQDLPGSGVFSYRPEQTLIEQMDKMFSGGER